MLLCCWNGFIVLFFDKSRKNSIFSLKVLEFSGSCFALWPYLLFSSLHDSIALSQSHSLFQSQGLYSCCWFLFQVPYSWLHYKAFKSQLKVDLSEIFLDYTKSSPSYSIYYSFELSLKHYFIHHSYPPQIVFISVFSFGICFSSVAWSLELM